MIHPSRRPPAAHPVAHCGALNTLRWMETVSLVPNDPSSVDFALLIFPTKLFRLRHKKYALWEPIPDDKPYQNISPAIFFISFIFFFFSVNGRALFSECLSFRAIPVRSLSIYFCTRRSRRCIFFSFSSTHCVLRCGNWWSPKTIIFLLLKMVLTPSCSCLVSVIRILIGFIWTWIL